MRRRQLRRNAFLRPARSAHAPVGTSKKTETMKKTAGTVLAWNRSSTRSRRKSM
jgi:hypothetical protein